MARAKATKSKPAEKKKSKATAAASGSKRPAKRSASKGPSSVKKPASAKAPAGRTADAKPKASGKPSPKTGKAAKKAPATKNVPAKKAPAKKTPARKAPARKAPARKAPAEAAAGGAGQKKAAPKGAVGKVAKKAATKKSPAAAKASGGESPKPKKKAGIEEVKAAAARTSKKVSKRGRKRQRVTPTSTPLANWIPKDGLRPSSFLPAPPRAQSAFTVAAAPASSDRLVRDEDLTPPAPIRTIPVLVNVVQEDGRIELRTNPAVVEVAPGDAVEWDFRYFGGADVLVTQVAIEISRPSPFGKTSYKSAKPGSARPHRHVSDIVKDKALGSSSDYSIHCTNAFKTELAQGSASIVVREAEPTDAAH